MHVNKHSERISDQLFLDKYYKKSKDHFVRPVLAKWEFVNEI